MSTPMTNIIENGLVTTGYSYGVVLYWVPTSYSFMHKMGGGGVSNYQHFSSIKTDP